MPEGPEIYLSCKYINDICKSRLFGGKVTISEVSKNPEVPWDASKYRISADSKGKEIKIILKEELSEEVNGKPRKSIRSTRKRINNKIQKQETPAAAMNILLRFGMSGSIKFTSVSELPKHAHLRFYTINETPPMVLSFVDPRRFGRWEVNSDWSKNRGPDPVLDYSNFRNNVLENLNNSAFNRPICEALLNQQFFNGIGNYLRAEILYRALIPPFEQARAVLEPLASEDNTTSPYFKADILQLCHEVYKEASNLGGSRWYAFEQEVDHEVFENWLRCYFKPDMSKMLDHNKRTIWFHGKAGPMAPVGSSKTTIKPKKRGKKSSQSSDGDE